MIASIVITQELLTGLLSSISIIASAAAIQLRASSRAQRHALRKLREREIAWGIYAHLLREKWAIEGKNPPAYPKELVDDDTDTTI